MYALFLGCIIPFRLPFIEKTARTIFDLLDVEVCDIPQFSCCPNTNLKPLGEITWHTIAARNLALAEKENLDIVCLCSGCSKNLKTANVHLKNNPELLEEVNSRLSRINLEYNGTVNVRHFVEVLLSLGLEDLEQKVVYPLTGIRIAPHYGCHLLRPSEEVLFDDPLNPKSLDKLVEILGATSVNYETKMLCCGGELSPVDPEESFNIARRKLKEVRDVADCLTVVCPFCFTQYDSGQVRMKFSPGVPIIHYLELLALAMGVPLSEIGFSHHRVKPENLIEEAVRRRQAIDYLSNFFDVELLKSCVSCGACSEVCPIASQDYNPHSVVSALLEGRLDDVIEQGNYWKCAECYTCHEMCPQRMGLVEIFSTLKRIAVERRKLPPHVVEQRNAVIKNGFAIPPSMALRKRFGLPAPPSPNVEELKILVKEDG